MAIVSRFSLQLSVQYVLCCGFFLAFVGCGGSKPAQVKLGKPIDQFANLPPERIESLHGKVRAFCADCHVYPDPSSYPKANWSEEVSRGFEFYEKSGRTDLTPLSKHVFVEYFQTLAPLQLEIPPPRSDLEGPVKFRRMPISYRDSVRRPAVSHLYSSDQGLLVCDVTADEVGKVIIENGTGSYQKLFSSAAPAHVTWFAPLPAQPAGLLVAELGTFTPDDHDKGGVRFVASEQLAVPDATGQILLEKVGRVADVSVGDFNADGLPDVVVAEFGWHETGGMHILWNKSSSSNGELNFEAERLDSRHGASHVHVTDIDDDGDQDFVVLHSQEYESVSVYVNSGTGQFERSQVWNANVPDYGLSSMDLADVDSDGDLDVLLSNGDSMDSFLVKPHHGVQWLENKSESESLEFVHHPVAQQPAAYGAAAGDLDGDGDIDLVGCTMVWQSQDLNTLVWYEQIDDGQFITHPLDLSSSQHAAVELGDYDGDGDLDIAVGEFDRYVKLDFCGEIWWNDGVVESDQGDVSE